jgi:hypothetical protein
MVHQGNGKARELGLKGVEARRKTAEKARSQAELTVPANPQEIFEALAVLMGELRAGTTDPSTARAMATVSHAMLKAHEIIMAEKQQAISKRQSSTCSGLCLTRRMRKSRISSDGQSIA